MKHLNPVAFTLKAGARKARPLAFIPQDSPDLETRADKNAINHDHNIAMVIKMVKAQDEAMALLRGRVTLLASAFGKFVENAASQPTSRPRLATSSRKGSKPAALDRTVRAKSKRSATSPEGLPTRRRKP